MLVWSVRNGKQQEIRKKTKKPRSAREDWSRSCALLLFSEFLAFNPPSSKSRLLIANLELEFHVSPLRITDLKFSNRKFFTVSRVAFQPHATQLPTSTVSSSSIQPLASSFQNLIGTPRLEFRPNTTNHVSSKFLIETKTGLCISDSRRVTARAFPCVFHESRVTSHELRSFGRDKTDLCPAVRVGIARRTLIVSPFLTQETQ